MKLWAVPGEEGFAVLPLETATKARYLHQKHLPVQAAPLDSWVLTSALRVFIKVMNFFFGKASVLFYYLHILTLCILFLIR